MTRVLKLVKGSTTLNLLNATDGITLRAGGDNWQPQYPVVTVNGDPDPVVETMRLQCRGTSQNAIAGTMQIWADMMRGASIYRTDANGTAPVWLHAKLDDETNERRSIVHRIDAAWVDSGMTETIDQDVLLFDAAIERGPYWEDTTPVAMGTASIYTNLITNGSFVFGTNGWTETDGDGSAVASASEWIVLVAGATANTKISQTIAVTADEDYVVTFWTWVASGDGPGRWGVYDVTNSADIIARRSTEITSTSREPVKATFKAPSGCEQVRIDLWCSETNGDETEYDDVGLFLVDYAPCRTFDYTALNGDIVGDVPARVAPLTIRQTSRTDALVASEIETMWVGVRSEARHPYLSLFSPLWECESGVAGTNTSGTADYNTSGYYAGGTSAMVVNPGTETWARRVSVVNPGITANLGEYLWLLRARVTSGQYEVKLRWSISDSHYIEGPTVEASGTKYIWHEMGVQSLPLWDRRALTEGIAFAHEYYAIGDISVDIWARRTSGTGLLYLDCIGLVPTDEEFLVLRDVGLDAAQVAGIASTATIIVESPTGIIQGAAMAVGGAVIGVPSVSGSIHLPPGDGRLYLFANGDGWSTIAPLVEFDEAASWGAYDSAYYPRWLSLRGAE